MINEVVLPVCPEVKPCSECGLGFEPDNGVPRWEADPVVLKYGWIEGRCGNCGTPVVMALYECP